MSDQTYYTFTNETGYCIMANITPGIHEVVVNADGYSPRIYDQINRLEKYNKRHMKDEWQK